MDGDDPRPAGAARGEASAAPRPRRWPLAAFGAAAVVSCWNPIAAPFGMFVGAVTAVLAARALRGGREGRSVSVLALALGVVAVIASVMVLALTAGGLGVDLGGEPVVKGRSPAELDRVLSDAAGRTKERRDRALQELEAQRGQPRPAPRAPPSAPGAASGTAPRQDHP
jgi:hypothetical protein